MRPRHLLPTLVALGLGACSSDRDAASGIVEVPCGGASAHSIVIAGR
jgi:hypothetical protein